MTLQTDLRDRLVTTLTHIFDDNLPLFLCDSPPIVDWIKFLGFNAQVFREDTKISSEYHQENILAIGTDDAALPSSQKWEELFRNSRVLMIPLVSFDPSIEAAKYTMELLASSTFETAIQLNQIWLELLLNRVEPMLLQGNGSNIFCAIEDDVNVLRPKTSVQLLPSEWESIGAYFEVGMVSQPDNIQPGFTVNGILSVPGVAVAHHRPMPENLLPMAMQAWKLFQQLHEQNSFPLQLHIENSRVTRIFAGKQDITEELLILTNKRREMILTEMAFSTNHGVIPANIDWRINAQLNEGAIGIHVGLGDGLTGAHIDFICPGVELQNK